VEELGREPYQPAYRGWKAKKEFWNTFLRKALISKQEMLNKEGDS